MENKLHRKKEKDERTRDAGIKERKQRERNERTEIQRSKGMKELND